MTILNKRENKINAGRKRQGKRGGKVKNIVKVNKECGGMEWTNKQYEFFGEFEEKRFEVNEEEIGEAFEDFKKQDEQKC